MINSPGVFRVVGLLGFTTTHMTTRHADPQSLTGFAFFTLFSTRLNILDATQMRTIGTVFHNSIILIFFKDGFWFRPMHRPLSLSMITV